MIELNEPQIWTVLGVFTTLFFGTLTIFAVLFTRVLRAEIGGLRGEMNAKFETVNTRIDALGSRVDAIDRDVQVLVKRTFGLDRN
ncbi:hypothetical protein [Agromyces aerolatus]|uniref:hypothetical protein n=1 Tax=Agromyces sp. LY-1074 TaxID=3074080 RepID=UPI002864365A|nr:MULTISPECIES: hypothetical protein [unclassified Agromyces]MDR5701693.1 hypothetical protein [Agromyces sp. LY-1074]MDR5707960.1 hypothetical protein [Agromyces sp. LY-1358]